MRALRLVVGALLAVSSLSAFLVVDRQPSAHAAPLPAPKAPVVSARLASQSVFPLTRRPTPAHPLRVMVIGDSVMQDTEPALAAVLAATGEARVVTTLAHPWWGLTTYPTWAQDWPGIIARYRPDVVIGTWSWDMAAALYHPDSYRPVLDRALSVLLAPGDGVQGVVLFSIPRIGPHPGFGPAQFALVASARQAWNRVAAAEAAGRRRVAYLDVADVLEYQGRHATWLMGPGGRWGRVRMLDEVHPCPTGAALMSAALENRVGPAWRLARPRTAWWDGAWVHNPLYETPPGACPGGGPPPGYQP